MVVLPRLAGNVAFGDDLLNRQADPTLAAESHDGQLGWFKSLAAGERVFLAAAMMQKSAAGWVEVGLVFSPQGVNVGCAVRVHVRSEGGLLAGGDEIAPVDLPLGRAGLLVGDDAWSPEQCRILALSGCDLFLSLQAIAGPYRRWKQVAGLWQLTQQNQVFSVESCLVGGGYAGVSAILGPCDMAPHFSGFLAEAGDAANDSVLVQALSPDSLKEARTKFPIFKHFNVRLYDAAFAKAFAGGDPP